MALRRGRAQRDLVATLQDEWLQRFGGDAIDRLRAALVSVVNRLPIELPHHVTGYGEGDPERHGRRLPCRAARTALGFRRTARNGPSSCAKPAATPGTLPLPALLSQGVSSLRDRLRPRALGRLEPNVELPALCRRRRHPARAGIESRRGVRQRQDAARAAPRRRCRTGPAKQT